MKPQNWSFNPYFANLPSVSLSEACFVVFDLETSGGNPDRSEVLEFAAIKVKNGVILGTYESLVFTGRRIPRIVQEITGLTREMLVDAPKIETAFAEFMDFVGDDGILVSHNVHSDIAFVDHLHLKHFSKPLPNHYLCTHVLAQKLVPDSNSFSLGGLIQFLNLPSREAHRALADAEMGLDLFNFCLEQLSQRGLSTVHDVILFQDDFKTLLGLDWKIEKKETKLPRSPGLIRFTNTRGHDHFCFASRNLASDLNKLDRILKLPRSIQKV